MDAPDGATRIRLKTGDSLSSEGEAVARVEGKVIFVAGAVPDEEVEVELVSETKSFSRGRVLSVLKPGPSRVAPRCTHFDACGGCSVAHVEPSAQSALKWQLIQQTLTRLGQVDFSKVKCASPWSGPPFEFRVRARWSVTRDGRLGYRAHKSHEVVDVEECPILSPELSRGFKVLRAVVKARGAGANDRLLGEVGMVASGKGVSFSLSGGLKPQRSRLVEALKKEGLEPCTTPDGAMTKTDRFGLYKLSPRTFSQSHPEGNGAMLDFVASLVESTEQAILELFGGSGNFTRVLSTLSPKVTMVEGSKEACSAARAILPDTVQIMAGDVGRSLAALQAEHGSFPQIFVNPPREGLTQAVVDSVADFSPKSLVYVSCSPSTFARDVKRFAQRGLVLDQLQFFDLYPHTMHAEMIGHFSGGLS